jgi:hypothetical protein
MSRGYGEEPSSSLNSELFFSRIRKRFAYHCIKEKSLNKYTTRFYRAPKEVNLTQPKLDHSSKRSLVLILHKKNNQYQRNFVS